MADYAFGSNPPYGLRADFAPTGKSGEIFGLPPDAPRLKTLEIACA